MTAAGNRPAGEAQAVSDAEAIVLLAPLGTARGLALAVSGGPDSMALMALVARWQAASDARPPVHALTVDHGLRPEAAAEAALVAASASSLGLPHRILQWSGAKPAAGLQDAARKARYRLLEQAAVAAGCDTLVTAHHADDQLETMMMRLLAGSGPAGLAGMRAFRPLGEITLARPLLAIGKARLVATAHAHGVPFVTDPGNADPRQGRGALRVLNRLSTVAGLSPLRLERLSARLRRADEALAAVAASALGDAVHAGGLLDWARLVREPDEIRLRALQAWLQGQGVGAGQIRLARLEALMRALDAARAAGIGQRRTFAGLAITLTEGGILATQPEPPRRRGRRGCGDPDKPTFG